MIDTLLEQFQSVFVVENESGEFKGSAAEVNYIANAENQGLAVAINQLCDAARGAGFRWLVLFDQDSRIPSDFRAELDKAIACVTEAPALLAANYQTELLNESLPGYPLDSSSAIQSVVVALNSGSMINLATHKRIGGHDERFFVDHVDHDYCLRLRARGHSVLATVRPLFLHEVGNVVCARRFGRIWQSSGHTAARRREWAAGLVVLARKHWRTSPGWIAARVCLDLPRNVLAMIILEPDRMARLRALFGGLWRGLTAA